MRVLHSSLVFVAIFIFVAGGDRFAHANDTGALDKIVELNKRALQTYQDLDMETAVKLLKQALELCGLEGIEGHKAAARTHVHLGVVYVSGLKLREQAVEEFRKALGIDPTIRITKTISNPEAESAFFEALSKGGLVPPPSPVTTVAPAPSPAKKAVGIDKSAVAKDVGITHPPVTESIVGRAIEIKVEVPTSLHADRVILAYRTPSDGDFLAREMRSIENAPEWFNQKIPAQSTPGTQVLYYIEAQDADGQALASSGSQSAPHPIRIISEASEASENVAAGKGEAGSANGASMPLWFVLAAGAGGGYYSGTPEMNSVDDAGKSLKSSGTGMAALGHLAPEIGFFYSDHVLLSVQGRLQYVSGGQNVTLNGKTYKSSSSAMAGLAKFSYFPSEVGRRFQPFMGVQAGAGEIRYQVTTSALLGCGANGASGDCKDTVRGGMGLAGGFAGMVYMLGDNFGVYTSLGVLAGLPNFALDADLNVGLTFIQ